MGSEFYFGLSLPPSESVNRKLFRNFRCQSTSLNGAGLMDWAAGGRGRIGKQSQRPQVRQHKIGKNLFELEVFAKARLLWISSWLVSLSPFLNVGHSSSTCSSDLQRKETTNISNVRVGEFGMCSRVPHRVTHTPQSDRTSVLEAVALRSDVRCVFITKECFSFVNWWCCALWHHSDRMLWWHWSDLDWWRLLTVAV